MAMSNFVNQAFLKKSEESCFFENKKKTIAAFDLKVVDADDSLSLFVIFHSNDNSELTLTLLPVSEVFIWENVTMMNFGMNYLLFHMTSFSH